MLEFKRKLLLENAKKTEPKEEKHDTRSILKKVFVGRAWEVWDAAKRQYPTMVSRVGKVLVSLILSRKITGPIDGGQLYWLFRRLGIPVRIETKIRFYESGKLKTLEEKIKRK